MFHLFKKSLITFAAIFLMTGCSAMYKDQQRVDRIHHQGVSYTQSMMKIKYKYDRNSYPGSSYKLYLDNQYLLTSDKDNILHLTDKKLRWKLYESYKTKGKLCFEIRKSKPKYDLSLFSEYSCLINTELEKKFAADIEIEEIEQKIKRLKRQLKNESVINNSNFNAKTQACDKAYIKPISNLCGKPKDELDRLYIDCFRPLGSKACRYAAKQHIAEQNISTEEKRRQKLASALLCKKAVGGDISGAEIADELGDELTSSDNIFVQGAGYLLEAGAALATTATVSSCLARFDMHCDVQENQSKERVYKRCRADLVTFNKARQELNKLDKRAKDFRYKRSQIVRNTSPKEHKNLILTFNDRF